MSKKLKIYKYMSKEKEQLLVKIQANFRKNIKGAGLIYMGLYELIETERPITPESIAAAVYMPVTFAITYEHIWKEYI